MTQFRLTISLLFALTTLGQAEALAANAWLSINLQFNTPGNFASGGTWMAVGKAEPQGFAGINMYVANVSFGSFLAPPQFDVQLESGNTSVRNVLVGDDLIAPIRWESA